MPHDTILFFCSRRNLASLCFLALMVSATTIHILSSVWWTDNHDEDGAKGESALLHNTDGMTKLVIHGKQEPRTDRKKLFDGNEQVDTSEADVDNEEYDDDDCIDLTGNGHHRKIPQPDSSNDERTIRWHLPNPNRFLEKLCHLKEIDAFRLGEFRFCKLRSMNDKQRLRARSTCALKGDIEKLQRAECRAEWLHALLNEEIVAVEAIIAYNDPIRPYNMKLKLRLSDGRAASFKPCGSKLINPENESDQVVTSVLDEIMGFHRVAPAVIRNISRSYLQEIVWKSRHILPGASTATIIYNTLNECIFDGDTLTGVMTGWWTNITSTATWPKVHRLLPKTEKRRALTSAVKPYIKEMSTKPLWLSREILQNHFFHHLINVLRPSGNGEFYIGNSNVQEYLSSHARTPQDSDMSVPLFYHDDAVLNAFEQHSNLYLIDGPVHLVLMDPTKSTFLRFPHTKDLLRLELSKPYFFSTFYLIRVHSQYNLLTVHSCSCFICPPSQAVVRILNSMLGDAEEIVVWMRTALKAEPHMGIRIRNSACDELKRRINALKGCLERCSETV